MVESLSKIARFYWSPTHQFINRYFPDRTSEQRVRFLDRKTHLKKRLPATAFPFKTFISLGSAALRLKADVTSRMQDTAAANQGGEVSGEERMKGGERPEKDMT